MQNVAHATNKFTNALAEYHNDIWTQEMVTGKLKQMGMQLFTQNTLD